jgi:antitoxin component of MazEF toxin-antitoxin module
MRVLELKLRSFGNSLGIVLLKDVIQRLRKREGERLFLVESQDGTYNLTSHVPELAEKMAKAEDVINHYRNPLRALAKQEVHWAT